MNTQPQTPEQWEQHYIAEMQNIVQQNTNYLSGVTYNISMGMYYDSYAYQQVINYEIGLRNHLNNYDVTAKWFEERNLHQFSDYLTAVKKDLDAAIATMTNTVQGSKKSEADMAAIYNKSQQETFDMYKQMNEDRKASFEKMNEQWRKNF